MLRRGNGTLDNNLTSTPGCSAATIQSPIRDGDALYFIYGAYLRRNRRNRSSFLNRTHMPFAQHPRQVIFLKCSTMIQQL